MRVGGLPVLWLYGPSGVGKTTACFELFTRLSGDGIPTGYVDIDQLGMCYATPGPDNWPPEPESDPGRHRLKARALDAVVANARAAGARCLVVSGVVDPERGADVEVVPNAALTLCRLRAEPAELGPRLGGRGGPNDQLDNVLPEADALDRARHRDAVVDTAGRTVPDVLRSVRYLTGGWPDLTASQASPAPPPADVLQEPHGAGPGPGPVLWLCGVTAVGKSTVGWEVYRQVRAAGHHAAFVDLDQIGFYRPVPAGDPGNHRLRAADLAAVWRRFRDAGATCLVAVGPVDRAETVQAYAAALPAGTLTVCRLHGGRDRITERVALRGLGQSPTWGVPGDELVGQPAALLARVADRASADAQALDLAGLGDLCVDTDSWPVPDIAAEILRRTGWPDPAVGTTWWARPERGTRRGSQRSQRSFTGGFDNQP
jgi:adenylylsulfate kinase-like enzyme